MFEGREMTTWTPVTENLPFEKRDVLVLCSNGKMAVAQLFLGEFFAEGAVGGYDRTITHPVTHWQYLPALPKG